MRKNIQTIWEYVEIKQETREKMANWKNWEAFYEEELNAIERGRELSKRKA